MGQKVSIRAKNIELIDVDLLIPYEKNMNKHTDDQIDRLIKLIEYQGFRDPIIAQKGTNIIAAGHGRVMAAKKMGFKKIPVTFQEFENEAQFYSFVVSHNAINSNNWGGGLDLAQINVDMLDLGPDLDIEQLGLKDFVLEPVEKFEGQCDEDDVPEVVHPITRRGDIWLLGNHRLMCGDSTMIDDVEKLMNGEKADMVWTDPPYNVAYEGKTKDALKIQNDEMSAENFYQFLYDAYSNMLMFTKPGGAIYVAHADSEGMNFRKAMIDSGWLIKQCLIWVKQALVMGRQDYHWKHEPILYGWAPGASHNWYADRKQTTVLEFDRPSRNAEHPTMKPVELIEYCLNNSCAPKGLVLDLFGGSGSTLIACEKTNRKCYGMELDEKYCDVIIKRWEQYSGKKATLESTGQSYEELKVERDGQTS